ncbi:hypothetical protein FHL15_001098 [Xylaria flabelliformis]|uniref:Sm domain-containing protein n=1 Tax=Xylaria flabelliformis TaxID=2512241 RepID=A0A553ICF4_9PEZI|nr:hypothetical protein FHL15_001098 [Xylaria flabelliformis]
MSKAKNVNTDLSVIVAHDSNSKYRISNQLCTPDSPDNVIVTFELRIFPCCAGEGGRVMEHGVSTWPAYLVIQDGGKRFRMMTGLLFERHVPNLRRMYRLRSTSVSFHTKKPAGTTQSQKGPRSKSAVSLHEADIFFIKGTSIATHAGSCRAEKKSNRANEQSNPHSFFKTLIDHEVTVELKNDIQIRGTLKSVDQYLNIKLDDIQVVEELKYPHLVGRMLIPSQSSVKNVFIRGSVVRYVHLPAAAVDVPLLEDATRREAANQAGKGK